MTLRRTSKRQGRGGSGSSGSDGFAGHKSKQGGFGGVTNTVSVMIRGLQNTDFDMKDLESYLKKKAKKPLHIVKKNCSMKKIAYFEFKNESEANHLVTLDGLSYKNCKLSITIASSDKSNLAPRTSSLAMLDDAMTAQLVNIIGSRYKQEGKFLDLSEITTQCNMKIDSDAAFVNTILSIIQRYCSDVTTISLESNKIRSLANLRTMPSFAPHLKNLSLANNAISHLSELDHLEGYRDSLDHIILEGNAVTNDAEMYSTYAGSVFLNLKNLDRKPFQSFMEFGIPTSSTHTALPAPKPSFFATTPIEEFSNNFVRFFFECYDTQREKLLDVYDDSSSFTVTIGTGVNNIPNEDVGAYSKHDRNLVSVSAGDKKCNERIKRGKFEIISLFRELPPTRHDLFSLIADVVPVPSKEMSTTLLSMSIHGQFQEQSKKANVLTRNFNRVFSIAMMDPQRFIILSEHLHLYSSVPSKPPVLVSSDASASAPSVPSGHPEIVLQIAQHAGVSPEVAATHLRNTNGNAEMAVQSINQARQQGQF